MNFGASTAVVLGSSNKKTLLVDLAKVKEKKIPIIKRFSGGGTVVIDQNTLFVTFVINKDHLDVPLFPEPILRWSSHLYSRAWKIPQFQLKENDYCIGEKKCGGNAQYIRKNRWLHHTSFLWDYSDENMECLRLPHKQPLYRKARSHKEFLCRLNKYGLSPKEHFEAVKKELKNQFILEEADDSIWDWKPHRQVTAYETISS